MKLQSQYLSTSKIAKILDINEKWLREHRGSIFIEGVHYHFPQGFSHCRWNVPAMLKWIETSNHLSEVESILTSLCH
jgi:hypothetical protein